MKPCPQILPLILLTFLLSAASAWAAPAVKWEYLRYTSIPTASKAAGIKPHSIRWEAPRVYYEAETEKDIVVKIAEVESDPALVEHKSLYGALGAAGWELVAVATPRLDLTVYHFKRPSGSHDLRGNQGGD